MDTWLSTDGTDYDWRYGPSVGPDLVRVWELKKQIKYDNNKNYI